MGKVIITWLDDGDVVVHGGLAAGDCAIVADGSCWCSTGLWTCGIAPCNSPAAAATEAMLLVLCDAAAASFT